MIRASLPLLAAIGIAFALPAAGDTFEGSRLIHVVGTGTASAVPDIARLTLGTTAEGETAKGALDESSAGVAGILATLDAAGVEARDIQTSRLDLSPIYTRHGINQDAPPTISGYRASNQITVTIRDLDGMGTLLDAVASAGATDFRGIRFDLSDPAAAQDDARRAAMADARARAALYAEAAEVTLGPVVTISEGAIATPRPFAVAAMRAEDAGAVPVAAGEATIRASINVTFSIE